MTRVTHYEATVHYTSTGSSSTTRHPFMPAHAEQAGAILYPDGLDYSVARQMCASWPLQGQRGDIRYSYRTLIEDDLRHYTERKAP